MSRALTSLSPPHPSQVAQTQWSFPSLILQHLFKKTHACKSFLCLLRCHSFRHPLASWTAQECVSQRPESPSLWKGIFKEERALFSSPCGPQLQGHLGPSCKTTVHHRNRRTLTSPLEKLSKHRWARIPLITAMRSSANLCFGELSSAWTQASLSHSNNFEWSLTCLSDRAVTGPVEFWISPGQMLSGPCSLEQDLHRLAHQARSCHSLSFLWSGNWGRLLSLKELLKTKWKQRKICRDHRWPASLNYLLSIPLQGKWAHLCPKARGEAFGAWSAFPVCCLPVGI